jgi:uncharacterized protein (DUF362 family)
VESANSPESSLDPLLNPDAAVVAVARGPREYPATAPFGPGVNWPEYARVCQDTGREPNEVYRTVRESFRLLGLDAGRFGSPQWNPFGAWIRPGDTVVVKPNFVRDFRESSADDAQCLITHGAVLRAVLDYAYLALGGRGRLVVADAPQNDADFAGIRRIVQIDAIADFYRRVVGFPIDVRDLRPEAATKIDGVIVDHTRLAGDPDGYAVVDLGSHSTFQEIGDLCTRLYGAEYDRGELVSHHVSGRHEYLLSRTVLKADCVISVPKLKTHKKTGMTANMKNLVGINGNKNWLPHHREGTLAQGGDQFDHDGALRRTERAAVALFKQCFPLLGPLRSIVAGPVKSLGKQIFGDTNAGTVRSGNWYGNDTTWRMVIDLNRMLYYADAEGHLHDRPVRRFLSVVDGIVGGEGNGPLDPTPRPVGAIIAGTNPVAVDLACARLMGFDYRKIPMLARAVLAHPLPLVGFAVESLTSRSNDPVFDRPLAEFEGLCFGFAPHFGWRGQIELSQRSEQRDEAGIFT